MKRSVVALSVVCIIMALAMASSFCVSAEPFEKSGECGESLSWSLDSETGVLRISGSGEMTDYVEHKTKYDTDQAPWSIYLYYIKSIVIEEGVTSVGDYAFYKCIYATELTLPESLTDIGAHAFEKCVSLERLDLSTIDSIGEYAFAGCKKLVGYTLKDGAVCAENSFEGAGKATVGCGAIVGGIAPVTVVIAAAFVLLKRKYN